MKADVNFLGMKDNGEYNLYFNMTQIRDPGTETGWTRTKQHGPEQKMFEKYRTRQEMEIFEIEVEFQGTFKDKNSWNSS